MNYEVIMFVVAFLCCGALVTVYVLWLAGLFSKRPTQQSVNGGGLNGRRN